VFIFSTCLRVIKGSAQKFFLKVLFHPPPPPPPTAPPLPPPLFYHQYVQVSSELAFLRNSIPLDTKYSNIMYLHCYKRLFLLPVGKSHYKGFKARCRYRNIFPATHRVFVQSPWRKSLHVPGMGPFTVHSPMPEKVSRSWDRKTFTAWARK
jgi:hypothetical protein